MAIPISAGLLDAMVLAVVKREDTYGYKITQDIKVAAQVSESTLYPVLRRLQKNGSLETYDKEYQGRNRRYYRVTETGVKLLNELREEWLIHKKIVDLMLSDEKLQIEVKTDE